MNNIIISFIITTMAGLSTMIGTFTIFLKNKKNIVPNSLLFAAGVMITVSLIDLIPESYINLTHIFYSFPAVVILLIFLLVGSFSSYFINSKLPSNTNSLYRVGIISMVAIIMHNIPEGIATFMSSSNNINVGLLISIAIALHNIPEGISIATPIYYSTGSRGMALLYTFISGLSEIFGAIIAYLFLSNYINDFSLGILYSFIAGIMIFISLFELIPEAKKQSNFKIIYFFIGTIFMFITHLLLK